MSNIQEPVAEKEKQRIDANNPEEVAFMHRQFPLMQEEQIIEAIEEAGPYRTEIMSYLTKRK